MKKILLLVIVLLLSFQVVYSAEKTKKEYTPEDIAASKGYKDELPDLTERFKKYQKEEAKPLFEYQEGFNNPQEIKPIPRNNPSFVNIIMKKEKNSQYLNDINDIIEILDGLQTVVEEKKDVQVFNAKAFYFNRSVEYFRNKYQNKSEESYLSYKKLMELNIQVQALSELRREREVYSPYITAEGSGNIYSQNTINQQLDYLLENIKKTMIVLKEVR